MTNRPIAPARIVRLAPAFVALALLGGMLAACGADSDSIDTVDDAVTLLQDVERDDAWKAVTDGMDALAEQDGYMAALELDRTMREVDEPAPPARLALTIEVDADGDTRYTLGPPAQGTRFVQFSGSEATDQGADDIAGLYRVEDGRYTCAEADMQRLLAQNALGVFESVGLDAISARSLAVIESDGENTILQRDTNHYSIESRHGDALAILERTGSGSLSEQIEDDAPFELSGTLDLDDATGALLHLEITYASTADEQRLSLVFDVTQWDDVPDIERPNAQDIVTCR